MSHERKAPLSAPSTGTGPGSMGNPGKGSSMKNDSKGPISARENSMSANSADSRIDGHAKTAQRADQARRDGKQNRSKRSAGSGDSKS